MDTFISDSAEETARLGFEAGRSARPGWVYGLSGSLGAGKTQWVKGFARGLGIRGTVRSPTFALMAEYDDGRLPLTHVDLYRLETQEQIEAAGVAPCFWPVAGVTVVEWYERWTGAAPLRLCRVVLTALNEAERRLEITYDAGCI